MVIPRDGTKPFVEDGCSDALSAIDTGTHTVIATLPTQHNSFTILASPDNMDLYVGNAGDTIVTVVELPAEIHTELNRRFPKLGLTSSRWMV